MALKSEISRTNKIIREIVFKTRKELLMRCNESDVLLLVGVFELNVSTSFEQKKKLNVNILSTKIEMAVRFTSHEVRNWSKS